MFGFSLLSSDSKLPTKVQGCIYLSQKCLNSKCPIGLAILVLYLTLLIVNNVTPFC